MEKEVRTSCEAQLRKPAAVVIKPSTLDYASLLIPRTSCETNVSQACGCRRIHKKAKNLGENTSAFS